MSIVSVCGIFFLVFANIQRNKVVLKLSILISKQAQIFLFVSCDKGVPCELNLISFAGRHGQLGQVVQMQTVVNMQLYYDVLVFMYMLCTHCQSFTTCWRLLGIYFCLSLLGVHHILTTFFLVLFTILCRINKTTTQHNRLRVLCAIILL